MRYRVAKNYRSRRADSSSQQAHSRRSAADPTMKPEDRRRVPREHKQGPQLLRGNSSFSFIHPRRRALPAESHVDQLHLSCPSSSNMIVADDPERSRLQREPTRASTSDESSPVRGYEVGTASLPVDATEVEGEDATNFVAGSSSCDRVSPRTRPRHHASFRCSG